MPSYADIYPIGRYGAPSLTTFVARVAGYLRARPGLDALEVPRLREVTGPGEHRPGEAIDEMVTSLGRVRLSYERRQTWAENPGGTHMSREHRTLTLSGYDALELLPAR